jgi:hypothetical protein
MTNKTKISKKTSSQKSAKKDQRVLKNQQKISYVVALKMKLGKPVLH